MGVKGGRKKAIRDGGEGSLGEGKDQQRLSMKALKHHVAQSSLSKKSDCLSSGVPP